MNDEICEILAEIINLSFETKTFPDIMKRAMIKPIYKKDDKDDISNYRPISILPILSKIFERIATDQIVLFLKENNLITEKQHAYQKFLSTTTCLAEVTNYIYKMLDNKKLTALLSIDLSKAFDSINHEL